MSLPPCAPTLKRSIHVEWVKKENGEYAFVERPRYWCYKCNTGLSGMYSPCHNIQCVNYNMSICDLIKKDECKLNKSPKPLKQVNDDPPKFFEQMPNNVGKPPKRKRLN